MRPGAVMQAAMDVLGEIAESGRPADQVLKHWGRTNRYAGSGDRARIGDIVFGVLRRKAFLAWRMDDDTPRGLVLAHQHFVAGLDLDALQGLCDGTGHNAAPLTSPEEAALTRQDDRPPPDHVRADLPDWLYDRLDTRCRSAEAAAAMIARAPLDLRVNLLKTDPHTALSAIKTEAEARLGDRAPDCAPCPVSQVGVRMTPRQMGRLPADLSAFDLFKAGHVEVQDEGSQIVSLLTGAGPGMSVLDLCAGAGGKSLALAGAMADQGRIIACDTQARRLDQARARFSRAGVTCAQMWTLDVSGAHPNLAGLRADRVLLDVPCSGSGTWRRAPDAKWRLTPDWLDDIKTVQAALLDRAADLVAPDGRLVYVTCSLLPEENADQITAFLARRPDFTALETRTLWDRHLPALPDAVAGNVFGGRHGTAQLAPHLTGTDGFFLAVLTPKPAGDA